MRGIMDIEFCECGGVLVPVKEGLRRCGSCGRVTGESKKEEIVVIENNEPSLPVMDKECPRCYHNKAYYWLIQTRSSDEPPTQFFRCTECKHVWREYK